MAPVKPDKSLNVTSPCPPPQKPPRPSPLCLPVHRQLCLPQTYTCLCSTLKHLVKLPVLLQMHESCQRTGRGGLLRVLSSHQRSASLSTEGVHDSCAVALGLPDAGIVLTHIKETVKSLAGLTALHPHQPYPAVMTGPELCRG